jgi:ubiquinone/menaquinone biosynthesis C-methylase UbiE
MQCLQITIRIRANTFLPPAPDNTFDLVYCRFLLIHLPDPLECLREMRRVLKPDGIIFVEDGDLSTGGQRAGVRAR